MLASIVTVSCHRPVTTRLSAATNAPGAATVPSRHSSAPVPTAVVNCTSDHPATTNQIRHLDAVLESLTPANPPKREHGIVIGVWQRPNK